LPPSRTGWRARGKKAAIEAQDEYLDRVLARFSGYIAADELYDGPFCVLSIVDNHTFERLIYEVLPAGESPTAERIEAFFRRFKEALDARGLTLRGITTDGSPLYPEPIAAVFGAVDHQICEFHILQDIIKAVLHAVAAVRKGLLASRPALGRGRPSGEKRRIARQRKRLTQRSSELFRHRHLFVQRQLTDSERRKLKHIARGQKDLQTLREIMDEVYRLFDRRCRMETALRKLAKLRTRVARFKTLGRILKKLSHPNLEKALTFLDDRLLPPTSNAVERSNRRHRKMQKSIYCVRTQEHLVGRIMLDMLRDARARARLNASRLLHSTRNQLRAESALSRRRGKAA